MASTLTARTRTAPQPSLAGMIGDLFRRARRRNDLRHARNQLRALDDHLLRDMGIERSQIDEVFRAGRH